MTDTLSPPTWDQLRHLIADDDLESICNAFPSLSSEDVVLVISHLDREARAELAIQLPLLEAARMISEIPEVQSMEILENISSERAAAILGELKSNEQVDLIHELDQEDAEAILDLMEPEESDNVRNLIQYDPDTAGGLMITEFLAFEESLQVRDVTNLLRERSEEYKEYNVQYMYVTSGGKFMGVLQVRDLLLSQSHVTLSKLTLKDALTVQTDTALDELINFFDTYDFYGVPVLDHENHLLGIVMRKDILKEETDLANRELLEIQGIVGGEELRTMPVHVRSRRRLAWLSVNIGLNIIAASVIAMYQDTLSAAIALAVFLPIISDMSGCSGNQAVAVSLRELSLGVVKPFELVRVWLQEVSVGLINGFVLGALLGLAAWLWQGSIYLGLVVGLALSINTVVAVSLGGTIPLFLKKMNVDPALASGPILTTITDMFGFLLALSLATASLSYFGTV